MFPLGIATLQDNLQKIDVAGFTNDKSKVFALVALMGCLLPWVTINLFVTSESISGLGVSKIADYFPGTILVSFLLYLFPLCLLGFIAADYIPQLTKYKRYFSLGSLVLVIYAGVGLYLAANPSAQASSGGAGNGFGMINEMTSSVRQMAKDVISTGWGYYVSLIGTIASFALNRKR